MTETGPGAEPPNPFSREGSQAPSAEPFNLYPPAAGADPGSMSGPPPPGFDPQPTPPYGSDGTASYVTPPPAYGSNPYEYTPYQPAYGGAVPYAVVQVSHPKAGSAMVFGILGIVFALTCGIGGLLGIPGIVQGRRARAEIDAEPGRYSGRSQAVAGIVTGVIGVVLTALIIGLAVVLVLFAVSEDL